MKASPEIKVRQTRGEIIASLVLLPLHFYLIPMLIVPLTDGYGFSAGMQNFLCYAITALLIMLTQWRFLRRSFDPLCENLPHIFITVVIAYGLMLFFNMMIGALFSAFGEFDNPNNSAVGAMISADSREIVAAIVFLAPLVEEPIFRGAIFGGLHKHSRILAYTVCVLAFSVYHIFSFAIQNPLMWVYALQYIPVTILLCRCYEMTGTIWSSIFFHMLVNGISVRALEYML